MARSHILGGERVAEQSLVGEVATSHTEPVPDIRWGDVYTSCILHESCVRLPARDRRYALRSFIVLSVFMWALALLSAESAAGAAAAAAAETFLKLRIF